VADFAAVTDDEHVEGVGPLSGRHRLELVVGLLGGRLGADEAKAFCDAVDVRVNGEYWFAEGEEQDACGGFGADAGDGEEIVASGVGVRVLEEFEGVCAVLFADAAEDVFDASRFDVCESADANGGGHCAPVGFFDGGPVGEGCAEAAEAFGGVFVVRILGEDGEDEDVYGRTGALPFRDAVMFAEGPEDAAETRFGGLDGGVFHGVARASFRCSRGDTDGCEVYGGFFFSVDVEQGVDFVVEECADLA